jgi:predicted nucleic acid-binding protein
VAKPPSAAARVRRPRAGAPSTWLGLPAGVIVLVDTAPFIYMLEDHPTLAPRFVGLFEAERRGELTIAITPVTVAELLVGPLKAGHDALARRYERELQAYELVPIDATLAAQAARLRVRYGLRLPDALQLAAALEVGAHALVTHDRDFAAVDGLQVLTGE